MPKGKTGALSQIDSILQRGGKKKKQKGGGARKIGRGKTHNSSLRYTSERRWETNQLRRVRRHLKRCPADAQARSWYVASGARDAEAFLAALPKVA